MPNGPPDKRNRKGCFVVLAIIAAFVVLYLLVGLNARPGNNAATKIQTVPASRT